MNSKLSNSDVCELFYEEVRLNFTGVMNFLTWDEIKDYRNKSYFDVGRESTFPLTLDTVNDYFKRRNEGIRKWADSVSRERQVQIMSSMGVLKGG